ncbi:hypothetical protein M885DRAFT_166691 [Pelagophyceae sp. CCMP2097]|nr:hypothetical protein M885DRAFT_166691 [Pelagophyceae sp. CCMP2097]
MALPRSGSSASSRARSRRARTRRWSSLTGSAASRRGAASARTSTCRTSTPRTPRRRARGVVCAAARRRETASCVGPRGPLDGHARGRLGVALQKLPQALRPGRLCRQGRARPNRTLSDTDRGSGRGRRPTEDHRGGGPLCYVKMPGWILREQCPSGI